jgi:hypothetical protein
MYIDRDGYLAHHTAAPPKGCAMTDEKKKDKKDKKDGKDAKKIDDEQLKDVAGGSGGVLAHGELRRAARRER